MSLPSVVISGLVGQTRTMKLDISKPYVNKAFHLEDNSDSTINLEILGNKVVGRFDGVFLTGNQSCCINVKAKRMWYTDISIYDGNFDNIIYLKSLDNGGHESSTPIFSGSNNERNRIIADIWNCQHQCVYSNAKSLLIERLTGVNVGKVLDIRAGSKCFAHNVYAYGVKGVQAVVTAGPGWLGSPTSFGELTIEDSIFWKCADYGIENYGKVNYRNLMIQAQIHPVVDRNPTPSIKPLVAGEKIALKPYSEAMPTPPIYTEDMPLPPPASKTYSTEEIDKLIASITEGVKATYEAWKAR